MFVTVKLSNGSLRSFDTARTNKDVVRSVAINSLALHSLDVPAQFHLLDVLETVFAGEADNSVLADDTLALAGIESVTVGNPAAVVAAPITSEDLPVYAATVDAQERVNDNLTPEASAFLSTLKSSPVKSTVKDFTPAKALVSRTLAIVAGAVALVVGAVAGASIF